MIDDRKAVQRPELPARFGRVSRVLAVVAWCALAVHASASSSSREPSAALVPAGGVQLDGPSVGPGASRGTATHVDGERGAPRQEPRAAAFDLADEKGIVAAELAASRLSAAELHAIDRTVWLAGRVPDVGLPTARAEQRATEVRAALATLASELASEREGNAWFGRLVAVMRRPSGEGDALWCAGARAIGLLRRYEFAPLLARGLASGLADEDGPPTVRVAAARAGLHGLYGRWFADEAAVRPFLESVVPGPGTTLLLESDAATEAIGRKRLIELLGHEPARATEWIGDPDPLVRAGAARVLGDGLGRSAVDRAATLDVLFRHARVESDPRAYAAMIDALLVPLESEAPEAPELERLRELLDTHGRTDGRALAVARGIARIPWKTEGTDRELHVLRGLASLGDLLAELMDAEFPDPDLMIDVLLALDTLVDRGVATELAEDVRRSPARDPVFALVGDSERPDSLRIAASETLAAFAVPEDWQRVIEILKRSDARAALGHSLLGVLRTILTEAPAGMEGTEQVLREVATLSGADDPDLRRRALTLLGEETIAPLVAKMDPTFLVERLASEVVPGLSRRIAQLLTRFGRPEMLDACLAVSNWPALVADSATLSAIVEMCKVLAAGDASKTMRAAQRLVGLDAEDSRIARTRYALGMVEGLDDAALDRLTPGEHADVCSWAWHLHMAGGDVLTSATATRLAERIAYVHRPRSAGVLEGTRMLERSDGYGGVASDHVYAVALGTIARAASAKLGAGADAPIGPGANDSTGLGIPGGSGAPGGTGAAAGTGTKVPPAPPAPPATGATGGTGAQGGTTTPVRSAQTAPTNARIEAAEAAFEVALEGARALADQTLAHRVLRDRARFRKSVGNSGPALADYRTLDALGALDIVGLRSAVELLSSIPGIEARRASATQLFDFAWNLISLDAWITEPEPVRMKDLRELADSAIRASDAERIRAFLDVMADLPPSAAPEADPEVEAATGDGAPVVEPKDLPRWTGLTTDPGRLEELTGMVARVKAALPAAVVPDPAPEPRSDG